LDDRLLDPAGDPDLRALFRIAMTVPMTRPGSSRMAVLFSTDRDLIAVAGG
jgi:hypothetical protein